MIRVAAYCRVSTEHDDQINSFESQKKYFADYISKNENWQLYEIYADEGISGTSTRKRTQFLRMLNDAYDKKFDILLTKEISRFSRNTLDLIRYTRELKEFGIEVFFLSEGFSTMDPDAEFRLTLLGSNAQDEVRKTSARVKWGQQRQMERGVVFGRSMLGYDVKNGKMSINPDGSAIVRLIFHKYVNEKKGTSVIARELREAGLRTHSGQTKWSNTHIIKILKNEKYVGDLVQKKTITPDYLSHQKRANKGEEDMIRIENHHEPIIDRETWNQAQEMLKANNKNDSEENGHSNRYIFSGKIKCGECHKSFVGRQKTLRDGSKIRRWSCGKATNEGSSPYIDSTGNRLGCDVGKLIRDDDAVNMLQQALRALKIDKEKIVEDVFGLAVRAIQASTGLSENEEQDIQKRIESEELKKIKMLDLYISGEITKQEMSTLKTKYDEKISELKSKLQKLKDEDYGSKSVSIRENIEGSLTKLLDGNMVSETFYKNILDNVVVYKDRHIELQLNKLPHIFIYEE